MSSPPLFRLRRSWAALLCLLLSSTLLAFHALHASWAGSGAWLDLEVPEQPPLVISLASTARRFNTTLPVTLWSLLRQPATGRIVVHLPLTARAEVLGVLHDRRRRVRGRQSDLLAVFDDGRIQLRFVPDQGPGTKFLPIIRECLLRGTPSDLDQPILVLDDDHAYSPSLVSTFVGAAHASDVQKDAALALRGWRVRRDLEWGVVGQAEYTNHVVEGWKLSQPYAVGVITANEGYLIRPRLFLPDPVLASSPLPADLPSLAPILNYSSSPSASFFVDDIWISGHLANLSRPRLVIPLVGAPSTDLTSWRPEDERPLQQRLKADGSTRAAANEVMLGWFKAAWEAEGIFYRFLDEGSDQGWVSAGAGRVAVRWLQGKMWEWQTLIRWSRLRAG